jgi:hypothetical protein
MVTASKNDRGASRRNLPAATPTAAKTLTRRCGGDTLGDHVLRGAFMHDANARPHVDRHLPFKQEGWGIALFIVLLAVGSAAFATVVHKRTYKHPTDVHFQAAGAASAGGSHGASSSSH